MKFNKSIKSEIPGQQEVRHVPRLSRNLISVVQLYDKSCVVTFNDKNWNVSKGSLIVEKGVKLGTLYLCTCHIVSRDNFKEPPSPPKIYKIVANHMSFR